MKKILFDFLPLVLFFAVYKFTGSIFSATAVLIPTTLIQVLYIWFRKGTIETMYLIILGLVIVLGGATILFHDITFIQWKPTIVSWVFATIFLGSELIGAKNFLERLSGRELEVPKRIWKRLNLAWAIFFIVIGFLNLYIAFGGRYTEEQWVNFKIFGILGLTILFVVLQSFYLVRHMSPVVQEDSDSGSKVG